jgi:hypothetical protein
VLQGSVALAVCGYGFVEFLFALARKLYEPAVEAIHSSQVNKVVLAQGSLASSVAVGRIQWSLVYFPVNQLYWDAHYNRSFRWAKRPFILRHNHSSTLKHFTASRQPIKIPLPERRLILGGAHR